MEWIYSEKIKEEQLEIPETKKIKIKGEIHIPSKQTKNVAWFWAGDMGKKIYFFNLIPESPLNGI